VALVLLSGRPGAGKTKFSSWLAEERGFVHVDTDAEWETWGPLVLVQTLAQAAATRERALELGADVIVEWGFKPQFLDSVRLLRTAGFDAWWLDGDEEAARQRYINRRGNSLYLVTLYEAQVRAIREASETLERFYGDHIVRTVKPGPTYVPMDEIATAILGGTTDRHGP